MIREVLADQEGDSSEPSSEGTLEVPPVRQALRFENYEVLTADGGEPIELGRGAMGITYKAFDVDLRSPVTLQCITEYYLEDQWPPLGFLRTRRAPAGVRIP